MRTSLLFVVWIGLVGAASAAPADRTPEKWALVVGASRLSVPSLSRPSADLDARAVAAWLVETAKWPADRVVLLTSDAPAPAARSTIANVRSALSGRIASRLAREDLLVVYFAGQAVGLPRDATGKRAGPDDYLLPADFDPSRSVETGWAIQDDLATIARDRSATVVALLDTSTKGRGESFRRDAENGLRFLDSLSRFPRMSAWIASFDKVSKDAPEGSPFRTALLEALGTAERPANFVEALAALQKSAGADGFLARGGLPPEASVWPAVARAPEPRIEPVLQRGHSGPISTLLISEANQLVTAGRSDDDVIGDSTIRFWNLPRPELSRVLSEPMGGVGAMARSADGVWLAAGSDSDARVWLWNLSTHKHVPTAPLPEGTAPGRTVKLGFLPGSTLFATIHLDGRAFLRSVDAAAPRELPRLAPNRPGAAAFAGLGKGVGMGLIDREGRVRLYSPAGEEIAVFAPNDGPATRIGLSADGRFLATATQGSVSVLSLANPKNPQPFATVAIPTDEIVSALELHGRDGLAVATNRRLRLIDPRRPDPPRLDLPFRDARGLAFSSDGRWLGAVEKEGGTEAKVWRLDADAPPAPYRLGESAPADEPDAPAPKSATGATALTFSPQGDRFAAGFRDGSSRIWRLTPDRDGDDEPAVVAPATLHTVSVSVSADGLRFVLLQRDGRALLWDLANKEVRRLPHRWRSIRFSSDAGSRVAGVLADKAKGDPDRPRWPEGAKAGSVLVHNLELGEDETSYDLLAAPAALDKARPFRLGLVGGAPVEDWVVAAEDPERLGARVLLWNRPLDGGKPEGRPAFGTGRMGGVDLFRSAANEHELVVRTDRVVFVEGPPPARTRIRWPETDEKRVSPWTCHAVAGSAPLRIALGNEAGEIFVWEPGEKRPPTRLGVVAGPARGICFAGKDRWLVASGNEKRFRVWDLAAADGANEREVDPGRNHHDDVIGSIAAWPNLPMILTASRDATVRLWNLETRRLVGTLTANPDARPNPDALVPWVAASPDARFDASPEARPLIRLVRDGETFDVPKTFEDVVAWEVTKRLVRAEAPAPEPARPTATPPVIGLKRLTEGDGLYRRVKFLVEIDPGAIRDLRIYRNDVSWSAEFKPIDESGRKFEVEATLVQGRNEFVAMAGRPETPDGRSEPIRIDFKPPTIGRLHVVALGVNRSSGASAPLRYAAKDAVRVADWLHRLDVAVHGDGESRKIVLTDDNVTPTAVRAAFDQVRKAVAGRPEDKVVLFVAGHTELLGEDFVLRLPPPADGSPATLKFADVFRDFLSKVEATKRLIVVDGCQTEKIAADPAINQRLREEAQFVANNAGLSATRWIFATRPGTAFEHDALGHGLLTYLILRGLADESLPTPPELPAPFVAKLDKTAVRDGTNVVDSENLRSYVTENLPALVSALIPTMRKDALRGAEPPGPNDPAARPARRPARRDPLLASGDGAIPIELARVPARPVPSNR